MTFDLYFALSHSKSLPVFNRCTPVDISCYAKFAEAVVTFVSDNSVLHRLIGGVMASKEIIVGLCLLALGDDLISMFVISSISGMLDRYKQYGQICTHWGTRWNYYHAYPIVSDLHEEPGEGANGLFLDRALVSELSGIGLVRVND